MRRINFGCGEIRPDGWINIDREDWHEHGDREHIFGRFHGDRPWEHPYDMIPDDSIDYVFANHSLCAVPFDDLRDVVHELHRVIMPGGTLRVSVPDILGAFAAFTKRDLDWFPNTNGTTVDDRLPAYLNWFGTNLSLFTPASLRVLLSEPFKTVHECSVEHVTQRDGHGTTVGEFTHARTLYRDRTICELDDRFDESVFFEAVK